MKLLLTSTMILLLSISCAKKDDSSTTTSSEASTLGGLVTASVAMTSAGNQMGASQITALNKRLYAQSSGEMIFSENQSSNTAIPYCSDKGGAWDAVNSEQAQPDDAGFAVHSIECLARVDETTETPVGFLSQIAFIGCMLTEAGVDLDVKSDTTFTEISINPSTASATCNALTNGSIKDDNSDYTFSVTVSTSPTGWDRKVEIKNGSSPFYTILMAQSGAKLAIKAVEYGDSEEIDGGFEVHVNNKNGSLIFESSGIRNPGHARLKIDGTMNSSFSFTAVSNVEGINIVCSTADGCNGAGSYTGATVKGALDALAYESIQVNAGTCTIGSAGCTATTGSDCTLGSGCLTYGSHATNTFANDEAFQTDLDDLTSGPICFTSVGIEAAPARAAIASCTL